MRRGGHILLQTNKEVYYAAGNHLWGHSMLQFAISTDQVRLQVMPSNLSFQPEFHLSSLFLQ